MTETWEYVDEQTVRISGDVTTKYYPNHIARFTQGGNTKFFVITYVGYDNGYTTMYLAGGGVYVVENAAITDHFVSVYGAPTDPPMDFGFVVLAVLKNMFTWEIPYDMNDTQPATNTNYEIKYVGGRFDKTKLNGYSGIYFEANLYLSSETADTVYAQLCDQNATPYTGSEISTSLQQWEQICIRSGDLSSVLPYSMSNMDILAKSANGGTYQIVRPRIIVRYGPPYVPLS